MITSSRSAFPADMISRKHINTRLAAHVPVPPSRHARENTINNARSGVTPVTELQAREEIAFILIKEKNSPLLSRNNFRTSLFVATRTLQLESIRFLEDRFLLPDFLLSYDSKKYLFN